MAGGGFGRLIGGQINPWRHLRDTSDYGARHSSLKNTDNIAHNGGEFVAPTQVVGQQRLVHRGRAGNAGQIHRADRFVGMSVSAAIQSGVGADRSLRRNRRREAARADQ